MKIEEISRPSAKKIEAQCWPIIAKAMSAAAMDVREPHVKDMRRICKLAIKYDLLEIAAISAKFLQHHFLNAQKHPSLGKKYTELSIKYGKLSAIESELLSQLQLLRYELNATLHPSPTLFEKLERFIEQIEPYLELDSPTIAAHCYLPLIRYYELKGNRQKMMALCQEAIQRLQHLNWTHHYEHVAAQIHMANNQLEQARSAMQRAFQTVAKGANTIYYFRITWIKIALYAGDYAQAKKEFEKVHWHNSEDLKIREQSIILRGYLYFLCPDANFYIGRYLNELNIYNHDKAGLNVNSIIIYILYYLKKDRARLVDYLESADRYARRHLQDRPRHFIRILLGLIRYDFNPEVVQSKMEKDFAAMESHPVNPDIEFVPFENLWCRIAHYLT